MKITEWGELGALCIEGDEIQYATELFNYGDYIGAFAVIGALIEIWLENCYDGDYAKTHDVEGMEKHLRRKATTGYRYSDLLRELREIGHLTQEESNSLRIFGNLRNSVIHRIVKYPIQPYPFNAVGRDDVQKGFEQGIKLAKMVQSRFSKMTYMTFIGKGAQPKPSLNNVPRGEKARGVPKE